VFINPQDEAGPSISSTVVPCSFVLSVYIAVLVLVFNLRPPSVRVVATSYSTILFPLLCSVLPFSPKHMDSFLSNFVTSSKCLKNFICAVSNKIYLNSTPTRFFKTNLMKHIDVLTISVLNTVQEVNDILSW
jgi:hypothetical protein